MDAVQDPLGSFVTNNNETSGVDSDPLGSFAGTLSAQPAQATQAASTDSDPLGTLLGIAKPAETMPTTGKAFYEGLSEAIGDLSEAPSAIAGKVSGPERQRSAAAQPYEFDSYNPSSFASKLIYRLAKAAPSLAGGIALGSAGAGLGTLAAGPPGTVVGGVAGGALGSGLVSGIQEFAPYFRARLRENPNDPDAAYNLALKDAGISAGFSAASWALFAAKPFQGPLKNLVFQAFGVQPSAGMAQQAVTNLRNEKPVTQDLGQAYVESAVGTAVPMIGHKIISGVTGAGRARGEAPQPTDVQPEQTATGEAPAPSEAYPNAPESMRQFNEATRQTRRPEFFTPAEQAAKDPIGALFEEKEAEPQQVTLPPAPERLGPGAEEEGKVAIPRRGAPAEPTNWLKSLEEDQRQAVFSVMRDLGKQGDDLYAKATPTRGYSVGSADRDYTLKAEALHTYLRHLRNGETPAEAESNSIAELRKIVSDVNRQRAGDVNWGRAEDHADRYIQDARAKIEKAVPSVEPPSPSQPLFALGENKNPRPEPGALSPEAAATGTRSDLAEIATRKKAVLDAAVKTFHADLEENKHQYFDDWEDVGFERDALGNVIDAKQESEKFDHAMASDLGSRAAFENLPATAEAINNAARSVGADLFLSRSSNANSWYGTLKTADGRELKVRLADHDRTSSQFNAPDFNIAPHELTPEEFIERLVDIHAKSSPSPSQPLYALGGDEREYPTQAATRFGGSGGKVFTGEGHRETWSKAENELGFANFDNLIRQVREGQGQDLITDGFVTNRGRFVDRKEAYNLVERLGGLGLKEEGIGLSGTLDAQDLRKWQSKNPLYALSGFHHGPEKAVEDFPQQKATPEQWRKVIESRPGWKDYVDWTGLYDWMEERAKGNRREPSAPPIGAQREGLTASPSEGVSETPPVREEHTEYGDYSQAIEAASMQAREAGLDVNISEAQTTRSRYLTIGRRLDYGGLDPVSRLQFRVSDHKGYGTEDAGVIGLDKDAIAKAMDRLIDRFYKESGEARPQRKSPEEEKRNVSRGTISKDELLSYMRGHSADLDERVLAPEADEAKRGDRVDAAITHIALHEGISKAQVQENWAYRDPEDYIYLARTMGFPDEAYGSTKFESHKIPGGVPGSYRELLIRLPELGKGSLTEAGQARVAEIDKRLGQLGPEQPADFWQAQEWADLRHEKEQLLEQSNKPKYTSKHFNDQELAHIRFDDRTGPNGEKTLFINEIQSDLHQKGRTGGYATEAKIAELRAARDESARKADALRADIENSVGKDLSNFVSIHTGDPNPSFGRPYRGGGISWVDVPSSDLPTLFRIMDNVNINRGDLPQEARNEASRLYPVWNDAKARLEAANRDVALKDAELRAAESAVPNAPFKGDLWLELALKRALRYAVDHGYDALSWARSDQIAKAVNEAPITSLKWQATPEGLRVKPGEDEWRTIKAAKSAEPLKPAIDLIRKRISPEKAAEIQRDLAAGKARGEISGFSVDNFGMQRQYNEAMGQFLDKYVKKWGAKVEKDRVVDWRRDAMGRAAGEPPGENPILRITPQMRESVMGGQAYAKGYDPGVELNYVKSKVRGTIEAGQTHRVDPSFVRENHAIIDDHAHEIPYDIPIGTLTSVKPLPGGTKVEFTFRTPDGHEFTDVTAKSDLFRNRAVFNTRQHVVGLLEFGRFGAPDEFAKSLVGGIRHEGVHALRLTGRFTDAEWDFLLSHANDSLKSLDWDAYHWFRLVGRGADPINKGVSIRSKYEDAYSGLSKGMYREYMDQEAVAHAAEGYHYISQLPSDHPLYRRLMPLYEPLEPIFKAMMEGRIAARDPQDVADFNAGKVAAISGNRPLFGRERQFNPATGKWEWVTTHPEERPLNEQEQQAIGSFRETRQGAYNAAVPLEVRRMMQADFDHGMSGDQVAARYGVSKGWLNKARADGRLEKAPIPSEEWANWRDQAHGELTGLSPDEQSLIDDFKAQRKQGLERENGRTKAIPAGIRDLIRRDMAENPRISQVVDRYGIDKKVAYRIAREEEGFEPNGTTTSPNLRGQIAAHLEYVDDNIETAAQKFGVSREAVLRVSRELNRNNGRMENPASQTAMRKAKPEQPLFALSGGSGGAGGPPSGPGATTPSSGFERVPDGPIGRLLHKVIDRMDLGDFVRDMQIKAAPMTARDSTIQSKAAAKDFANYMRLASYEQGYWDKLIQKEFKPEEQQAIWEAADEESVLRQQGKNPGPSEGLNRLTPRQRDVVRMLQERADDIYDAAKAVGIVDEDAEGLPSYVPRMVVMAGEGGYKQPSKLKGKLPLDTIGRNLIDTTPNMRHRNYLTTAETEAAARAKFGDEAEVVRNIRTLNIATSRLRQAVAGKALINKIKEMGRLAGEDTVTSEGPGDPAHKWFTLDHPSFKEWKPDLVQGDDGKWHARLDEEGNPIFKEKPLYVRGDFEGPLKAVLSQSTGKVYQGLLALKMNSVGLIMFSPMIHNAVEFSRALPIAPLKMLTLRIYRDGFSAKKDYGAMREFLQAGGVPIGDWRGHGGDAPELMNEPSRTGDGGWLSRGSRSLGNRVADGFGDTMAGGINKAMKFWHQTLLWDLIANLQMGLYTNLRDQMVKDGYQGEIAQKTAAHFANRYAGAVPQESMSDAARKLANLTMFSRSFTLGNIGVMKDIFMGLPSDVQAQIARDHGLEKLMSIKSKAKRKAVSAYMLDTALFYVSNSMLQNAANTYNNEGDEFAEGYSKRFKAYLKQFEPKNLVENPLNIMLNPFSALSATNENEPGKKDRIKVGYNDDGTAIYARNPFGKIGEEFLGYATEPINMINKKQSTLFRPLMQTLSNDQGFGRKVYDPSAETPKDLAKNAVRIAAHFVESQVPLLAGEGGIDLIMGRGNADTQRTAALQVLGPLLGMTFSKGYPGGPEQGEIHKEEERYRFRFNEQKQALRKLILGDDKDREEATQRMTEIGVPPDEQRRFIRSTLNPGKISQRMWQHYNYRKSLEEENRAQ